MCSSDISRAKNLEMGVKILTISLFSHLEAVNPIVEGKVRAEQFYR